MRCLLFVSFTIFHPRPFSFFSSYLDTTLLHKYRIRASSVNWIPNEIRSHLIFCSFYYNFVESFVDTAVYSHCRLCFFFFFPFLVWYTRCLSFDLYCLLLTASCILQRPLLESLLSLSNFLVSCLFVVYSLLPGPWLLWKWPYLLGRAHQINCS